MITNVKIELISYAWQSHLIGPGIRIEVYGENHKENAKFIQEVWNKRTIPAPHADEKAICLSSMPSTAEKVGPVFKK